MTVNRFAAVVLMALAAAPAFAQAPKPAAGVPPIPAYIQRAVDSDDRSAAMKARDGGRKPAQVFALSGLKEGDKVLEFGSFGHYDTTIIANAVGPKGHVYMYDLPYMQQRSAEPATAFVAKFKNASYVNGKFDDLTLPRGVDMAVFDMYYHDLKGKEVDTAKLDKAIFAALKPGGRVLVVDHKAADGSGWRDSTTIHRIGVEVIVSEMQAAGFQLAVNSMLFFNPEDDHTKMVFDPTERGATDRALLVFVKPR
jgi:predicted methyltransferase